MSPLFDTSQPLTASRTLALYQRYYNANGPDLPAGTASDMRFVPHLSQALDGLSGLILDSYGVIGLGSAPIAGILDLFDAAKARNMPVVILTNGASQPAARREKGYQDWGLPIIADDIVSSRDATHQFVRQIKQDNPEARFSYLGRHVMPFEDVPGALYGAEFDEKNWAEADYFIFLGAVGWEADDQNHLEAALAQSPHAKLIIGNPDVSAPVDGSFTFEPGFWGMKANEAVGTELIMAGKPFAPAYQLACEALQKKAEKQGIGQPLDKARIGMVGDSLHTDILGAKSFGLHAILLSGYGLMAGRDIDEEARASQIYPDMVAQLL